MRTTADWTTPVKSHDAATLSSTVSYGASLDLRRVLTDHAAEYIIGQSTGDIYSVWLEGSLDGSNWYVLVGSSHDQGTGAGSSATVVKLKVASLQPARYVRSAGYANAGSPTVTAWVTARE